MNVNKKNTLNTNLEGGRDGSGSSHYRGTTTTNEGATSPINKEEINRNLGAAEYNVLNPFVRGGAVQRSPPTKGVDQGIVLSPALVNEAISERNHSNTALPTGALESKESQDCTAIDLDCPGREEEMRIFARPLEKGTERTCVSARPSEKESEADVSDCSLASTASTTSGTRKRRQPYLFKPGKAKKTAVDEGDVPSPYSFAPVSKTKKKELPTVENIQHELKDCTSADIMARILESMSTIEKVADNSRNLRGNAHSLRLAARSAIAAASELAQRSSSLDVESLKKENGELRSELANVKSELMSLTTEVNRLRQRDAGVEGRSQQPDEPKMDKDPLARRITMLIDEKLAELRAEILPQKAAQQPVVERTENTREASQTKSKKDKKVRKKRRGAQTPPPVASQPETPSLHPDIPESEQPATITWAKAVGRKTRPRTSNQDSDATSGPNQMKKVAKLPPAPKTAAVTITLTDNATVDYATAMATAKQRVNLADCGISQVRQKKSITGGLVLEVPGPDSMKKADALAERLRVALANMGVRIGRPVKTGEVRVMDLDESITKQDVAGAIAEAGECLPEDVRVGEIRYSTSRLGTVWVRCPLTVVRKLAAEKYLRVGWVSARIRVLAARQLQCFRCLEVGHIRKHCSSAVDRSLCCYSCGEQGHKARECEAKTPKCPVCSDLGQPADHRLGGQKCNPPKNTRPKGNIKMPTEPNQASKTAQSVGEANKTKNSTS